MMSILRRIQYTALAASLFLAGTAIYLALNNEVDELSVEQVSVSIRDLPPAFDGYRIVQMSDFHLYPLTKPELIRRAVAISNELQPDLVALTGDFVWHKVQAIHTLAPILGELRATDGVYGIMGNHELWTNAGVVQTALEKAGIALLVNQGVTLKRGQEQLYLAGLDDGWSGHPDLDMALKGAPNRAPVILMFHEPDLAEAVARDGRVALQLAGHSHGGQVQFRQGETLLLPYLAWKYPAGLYQIGKMWLYTNRGLGVTSIPLRYNCPPEITVITLRRGEADRYPEGVK